MINVIYNDPSFVVIEKPSGLLAVPGRGINKQDCVVNRIRKLFPHCIEQPAVHRLDMDTSGLMVLALTKEAHRNLSIQFSEQLVEKKYVALLDGIINGEEGEIQLAFRLDPDNRPYQVYDPVHGKVGISRWRKLETKRKRTRIEFQPLTGRTHQLRLHSAHDKGLGCPIVGDRLYGNAKNRERLMLHAESLRFQHPETGEKVEFKSPPPF